MGQVAEDVRRIVCICIATIVCVAVCVLFLVVPSLMIGR